MKFALAPVIFLLSVSVSSAQSVIGPGKCLGCHDHEKQKDKWQREEAATLKGHAHVNAMKQLDEPKAAGFAKAIGLADAYDPKGSCVKCHATVLRGEASFGVSCESCHGAASAYLEPHQVKGAYAPAVAAGMKDLRNKPAAIGALCGGCHLAIDARLRAANHPGGDGFDAGAALAKVTHWAARYDATAVSAAARAAGGARAGGPAKPAAAPAATGSLTAAPPAAAAARPTASMAAAPRAAAPAASVPAAAAPAAAAAPWDWSQPVQALPDDYVPEPIPDPTPAPALTAGAAPTTAKPTPAPVAPRPIEVPLSLAEDTPLPAATGAPVANPYTAAVVPAAAASPAPRSERAAVAPSAGTVKPSTPARPPALEIVALRGDLAALLEQLLRKGAHAPQLAPAAKPLEFSGPEGEFLRLQDEALGLALEALRRPIP